MHACINTEARVKSKKTGARRFGILNALAIESMERYFEVSEGKDEEKLFPMTKTGVSKLLKRLARESNIVLTGNIRWHNLRSWLMSKLNTAGFSEFEVKYIVGKRIPLTDMTYLHTLQRDILAKYPEAYRKYLSILAYQTRNQTGEVEKLKAEVERLRLIMAGMREMFGEEIYEKATKRLGIRRSAKTWPKMTPEEREELLIKIAKAKELAEESA